VPRQLTSFVGREQDMARIASELGRTAVVTLTGVGGVGKTRLALEVAAEVGAGYQHGAWLCELAGVRDADAVPDAVSDVFDFEPRQGLNSGEALVRFLRAKELLLVLDNCEHVLKPVAGLVRELVRACPRLRILATSREGLNVAGERILGVASLAVPDSAAVLELIASSDAVRLFIDRAQAVRAGFVVDAANGAAVAQVCQRLDGVPLAIELAAARVAMLTPAELARRLDERFRILSGSERGAVERHQTLRAAIDWSYDLLDNAERTLLDRLSVFAGGFTLEAAEAVAPGGTISRDEVFDLLAGLVARSLVEADTEASQTRYRLLETIRQYAQERLDAGRDAARVHDAHAYYYADFAELAAAGMSSPAELQWWERLRPDIDNVRAALAWAIENQDADTALRFLNLEDAWVLTLSPELSGVLRPMAEPALAISGIADDARFPMVLLCAALHSYARGNLEAVMRYCDDALAAETRLGVGPSPTVWSTRVWVAITEGRPDEYVECSERALTICRRRGERVRLAMALTQAAMAHALKGDDTATAVVEIDEALTLARQLAIPTLLASTKASAAFVLADDQPERASVLMREALEAKEAFRSRSFPAYSFLGDVAERLGDRRQALELFVTAMDEQHWLGSSEVVGRMLRRIGLLLVDDDPDAAALINGAGTELSHGWTLSQRAIEDQRKGIEALNSALGTERTVELLAQGAAMEEHDAVVAARAAAARALAASLERETAPPEIAPADASVFLREGDVWTILYEGSRIQLRDAKGLRYLARLLAQPGREIHVSDLAAEGTGGEAVPASGSGGEILDASAKAAYQRRLTELDAELAEATEWNDTERAARAQAEMDALTEQLAGAYGLGGRTRSMGDPVERMRKAVTNRIKDSQHRIAAQHEALGRHLANAVHTGTFCSYTPERPMAWEL
jgi:predicted ATPase